MSLDRAQPLAQPLTSKEQLLAFFRDAEKPIAAHQVGLEHEKFIYPVGSATPVPYHGDRGIGALLKSLETRGYSAFREADDLPVIALTRGRSTISLEPGGQLELSGAPARTALEVHRENLQHLAEVKEASASLGLRLIALGYRPVGVTSQMPWMPKSRYEAMKETLSKRGRLARDMMLMTATGQVSFDWSTEEDCARKVCGVARLAPLMVALFANSPLVRGQPSGFLSYRSHVWTEVDPKRCGYLPSMVDGTFSYTAYVDWALAAPLLFLRREGKYLRPQMNFQQLLQDGFEGEPAVLSDWVDHLSTLFPEVRIKKVLEIRGADCVSASLTGALAALWRGILYQRAALEEAERLLPRLTFAEHLDFHHQAGKFGLHAKLKTLDFPSLARELVEIAARGLKKQEGDDAALLEPLAELAAGGRSPADRVLEAWDGDAHRVLDASEL